jgi:hypothetical protein
MLEVDCKSVNAIFDRRASRAASCVLGIKHEVIDEELRASSEELSEVYLALVHLESVLFINPNPLQPLTPLSQFVTTPSQLFFDLQQMQPS